MPVGSGCMKPNSAHKLSNHIASSTRNKRAMYSDSVVDNTVVVCFSGTQSQKCSVVNGKNSIAFVAQSRIELENESKVEVEVLGELCITKNSLCSDEMLLERLEDFYDDLDEVWSCYDHGVHHPSNKTLVKSSVIISQSIS